MNYSRMALLSIAHIGNMRLDVDTALCCLLQLLLRQQALNITRDNGDVYTGTTSCNAVARPMPELPPVMNAC